MRRLLSALALFVGLAVPAIAQTFPGDFAPGQVCANGTSSTGSGCQATNLSLVFDQALCGTNNKTIARLGGVWTCSDFLNPVGVDQNVVKTKTANYTIATADCGARIQAISAQFTVTLPAVTGFAANCRLSVLNGDGPGGRTKTLAGFPTGSPTVLWPTQEIDVAIVNGAWATVQLPVRWRLTAALVLNVDPAGNDSNDGLATGAAGAFATFGRCYDVLADNLDAAGQLITCLSAAGKSYTNAGIQTYKGVVGQANETNLTTAFPSTQISACSVLIDGNGSTLTTNTGGGTYSFATGAYLTAEGGLSARFCVRRFALTASAGAGGINSNGGFIGVLDGMNFGAMPGGAQLHAIGPGAQVNVIDQSYTISGGAAAHASAWSGAIVVIQADTVTLTGTPAFSSGFATAQWGGQIYAAFSTFAGAATGPRFLIDHGSIIDTQNPSLTYLPGNAAGTNVNGFYGVYFGQIIASANTSGAPTPIPGTLAQLVGIDGVTGTTAYATDTFGSQGALFFRRANTSLAAPSALALNDIIGGVQWLGYGTSAYSVSARAAINGNAAEAWTNTAQGAYLSFFTTPAGTLTVAERARLFGSGCLYVGAAPVDCGTNRINAQSIVSAGIAGSSQGTVTISGATSGFLTIGVQATAGTPVWTAGTGSGTPAVTASAPLAISATTGNLTITSPLPVANGGTNATAAGATAANNIGALAIASNLSDVASAATSRTNLGLGTIAVQNYTASTWTPALQGTTIAGTFTYTNQTGSYEIIGRQVIVRFAISISATSVAPTGNLQIAGLPVAAANVVGDVGICSIAIWNTFTLQAGYQVLSADIINNTSVIRFLESGTTKAIALVGAGEVNTTPIIEGMCNYHT